MNSADTFCALLRARVTLAQHQPNPLADLGPSYRCDNLFLVAADFSDSLTLRAQGMVGDDVVREYALELAAGAFAVYRASVQGEDDEDGCG